MAATIHSILIILTYKGKVLVMHTENNPLLLNEVTWRFIGRAKEKSKSVEETIFREVEVQTGIKLATVELLGSVTEENEIKHFYHAQLTDTNVNNMNRDKGQTIQFFSIKELDTLPLTMSTKHFISQYREIFEKVPNNNS